MENSKKRIALVTGSNRGIGFETSRQLAHKGLLVVMTSRNQQQGQEAARNLKNQGLEVLYHPLDVIDSNSVDLLYNYLSREFGRLDVLINNAGIFIDDSESRPNLPGASIFNTDLSLIRDTLETNTLAPLRMIQKMVPLMKKNNYGRIVNVSSGMGQLSEMEGKWPGYRISKTALNAVTRISAAELQGSNILVNSVCPGWVKTDMGGPNAALTPAEGADTLVWLATLPEGGPSGGFFRERELIPW